MATDHYCVFEVDSEFFAASATQIREITSKPDYAKAPCSSPILAGLWHEGSEFVPVLRIPFQIGEPQNETQLLVVHGQSGRWGLLVEQVHTIESIDCSQGGPQDEWATALIGMSIWKGNSVRVLNLDGLYRLAEDRLQLEWSVLGVGDELRPAVGDRV